MTAVCSVNGFATLSGKVFEPAVGVWNAQLEIDAEEAPEGTAAITFDGGQTLVGTITGARTVADEGRVKLRIEGGSGMLDARMGVQHFRNTTVRSLISDLTRQSGDTIDESSTILDNFIQHWTRPQTLAHGYLQSIADEYGARWRIQRSGQLWLGIETWPEVEGEFIEATKIPGGVVIYAESGPFVLPGTVFQGQRVAEVITTWGAENSAMGNRPLTQSIAFEDDQTVESRHTRSIQHEVADWFERTDGVRVRLSAMYPCRVTAQTSDLLKVDLLPNDPEVRGNGLNQVPIRYGMPGVRCTLKPGARVMLGYDAGDPERPFAAICDRDGIEKVHILPDDNGNVDIETSGSGVIRIISESAVQVLSPDIRLGSEGGSDVACKGDLVVGTCEPMFAGGPPPAGIPITNAAGLPIVAITGQITIGRPGVKAG